MPEKILTKLKSDKTQITYNVFILGNFYENDFLLEAFNDYNLALSLVCLYDICLLRATIKVMGCDWM